MSFLVKNFLQGAVPQPKAQHQPAADTNGGTATQHQNGAPETLAALPGGGVSAARPLPPATSAGPPPQRTSTRTLVSRIQTSEVAKDRRDALTELASNEKCGVDMHPDSVALFLNLLKNADADEDLETAQKLLEVLSNVTDPQQVPDRALRSNFLRELQTEVSLWLKLLQVHGFWVRYHSLQLLTRCHESAPQEVQKLLLSSRGIGSLIDVLNDSSNGGALRNQGLVLLTALTATDQELQTILAFENVFESLFHIIREEGGVSGGVIVSDCLEVMHNLLRGNRSTQKFFREMGCPKHFGPLLVSHLGSDEHPSKLPAEAASVVHACVAILLSLVRGADSNNEGVETRSVLVVCGLLPPLLNISMSSSIDEKTTLEALRTVSALVQRHKQACEAFLATRVAYRGVHVTSLWATLRTVLFVDDITMQLAALHTLASVLEVGGIAVTAAQSLVKNLSPDSSSGPHHNATAGAAGLHCGPLLGAALFSTAPAAANARYLASIVLHHVLLIPQVAEQLLHVPWSNDVTFFSAYLHQTAAQISERRLDMATMAASLRPLFTWAGYCAKSLPIFLNDPTDIELLVRSVSNTRETLHVRLLCGSLVALLTLMCPPTLPPTALLDRNSLQALFESRVSAQTLSEVLRATTTTVEWEDAPSVVAMAHNAVLYDSHYKKLVCDIVAQASERLQNIHRDPQDGVDGNTTAAAAGGATTADTGSHLQPAVAAAAAVQQVAPTQQQKQPQEAAPASSAELRQLREVLDGREKQVIALVSENKSMKLKLVESVARCDHLERELQSATMELTTLREHSVESTLILEEALHGKEEEVRNLAETLSHLEQRLSSRNSDTHQVHEVQQLLNTTESERDELLILLGEIEEELEVRRHAENASMISQSHDDEVSHLR